MRGLKLSQASWEMLKRLGEDTASICYFAADGRFYLTLQDKAIDLVRPSTMDALTRTGLVRRERSSAPWYSISERGRAALQRHIQAGEIVLQ
jgi:hypothetical protein